MSANLRQHVLQLWQFGLSAAEPTAITHAALIELARQQEFKRRSAARIKCIALGKAACAMADALNEQTEFDWHKPALAITNQGNARPVFGFEVLEAGHPLPDRAGLAAAERIAELARGCSAEDFLLVLISGGGSALAPLPPAGISLEDMQQTTDLLLSAGADIQQLNTVRKHLSQLKGGGLARLAYPAKIYALLLSDVVDDDPSCIASGPTLPDPSRFQDAVGILRRHDLWFRVPAAVREHLLRGMQGEIPETLKPGETAAANSHYRIVGSNRHSLTAMAARAQQLGYTPVLIEAPVIGEAHLAAHEFVRQAAYYRKQHPQRPLALLAGGETTVTVRGPGKGGRNQEFAFSFALAAEKQLSGDWLLLSAGTDGRDGPTEAAGALVDPASLTRIRKAGLNPEIHLRNNNAYPALNAADDLLITGPTGTNVADVQVVLWGEA